MAGPDHQAFLRDLQAGRTVEMWVATRLLDAGLTVRVGTLEQARTPRADDWRFPGAFTCSVKRWQARRVKPIAFVIVSLPTQAALAISSRTFSEWEIVDSRDSRRNGWPTPTYRAPRSGLRPFDELVSALVESEGIHVAA